MKRTYKLEDLCCANCAAKIETAINKIPGVDDAVINFMSLRLTISADDENFEDILNQAQKAITKIEPDCKIIRK